MTPVDEAVELVRGYVEAMDAAIAGAPGDHYIDMAPDTDHRWLNLSDLRALLSALELGSVASLPVKAVDEPATPLSAELLARGGGL